jgi:hypothetical protein
VALVILPIIAALPLRLMLRAPLALGEVPMFLLLLFAVLLFLLLPLGGMALKSGVAWQPILLLLFAVLPLTFLWWSAALV